MAANLPSPVVGAGGQGSRPWFEQLLLTLAAQGPSTLMQWMEHRQQGQQQQAIDAAAQGALTSMAPTMSPGERQGVAAAGGQPGAPTVQGQTTPSGIKVPTVAPSAAAGTPNFSGMKPGVAPALLEMFTQQRTATTAQDASRASAEASRATTKATLDSNERDAELQSGRIRLQEGAITQQGRQTDLIGEQITASQEGRKLSQAQQRLAERELKIKEKLLPLQIRQLEASISADNATKQRYETERNTLATTMANEHRQEFTKVYSDLLTTIGLPGGASSKGAAERLAAKLVYGTDKPPVGNELIEHYRQVVAGGQAPSLYDTVKERMQVEMKVTPEQYQMLIAGLEAAGGDARTALVTAQKRGATVEELSKAAIVYTFETGAPVQLPIDTTNAEGFKGFFGEFMKSFEDSMRARPLGPMFPSQVPLGAREPK